MLLPSVGPLFVNGGGIEGGHDRSTVPTLPEGSQLEIEVREPRPRTTMDAQTVQAPAIAYHLDHADHERSLPVAVEHVHPSTGNLVQLVRPSLFHSDEHGYGSDTRFTRIDRPPAMLAGAFWNATIDTGDTGVVEYPDETAVPANVSWGEIRYEVTQTEDTPEGCQARIDAALGPAERNDPRIPFTLTLREGIPLPVAYELPYPEGAPASYADASLALTRFDPGDGQELPSFEPTRFPDRRLPHQPLEDGFLADRDGVFPTSYDDAVQEIRSNEQAEAWFDDHPGAEPVEVDHLMGAPDDRIIDAWRVVWTDDSGEALEGRAIHRYRTPAEQFEETVVETETTTTPHRPAAPGTDGWVPLASIVDVYEQRHGAAATFVLCDLHKPSCTVGEHARTDVGYAGTTWAGIVTGLLVDLDRGWLLQETRYPAG